MICWKAKARGAQGERARTVRAAENSLWGQGGASCPSARALPQVPNGQAGKRARTRGDWAS